MPNRLFQLLVAAAMAVGASSLPTDPFVGAWKINPARSTLTDEMTIEAAGANRFIFTFGPGQVDTVVADGSDQRALSGTTLSITPKGPNRWTVVRKLKGRMLLSADWTLSADGRSLKDDFTQYLPDGMTLLSTPMPNGATLFMPYVYERTAGKSGLAGTWDSESATVNKSIALDVQNSEFDALTFKRSDEAVAQTIIPDGKAHPEGGGSEYAARRVNERTLDITHSTKGTITSTVRIELSTDLKTLTITERQPGQLKPKSVLVFDRI